MLFCQSIVINMRGETSSPSKTVIKSTLDIWKQTGSEHLILITGRSMLPLFHPGDRVRVTYSGASVQPGEVVVFQQGDGLVVHRVVRVEPRGNPTTVTTKGDNRLRCDAPVRADDLLGRALVVQQGSREIVLNTATWRWAGRLIAAGGLAQVEIYQLLYDFKYRHWGARAIPATGFLRRIMLGVFTFPLRLAQLMEYFRQ